MSLFLGTTCAAAHPQRHPVTGRSHAEPSNRETVARCVAALSRDVRRDKRYDRVLHLDRYILRARVRTDDDIFSIGQPVRVDATVAIKGAARRRGHWQWLPVVTRCGLRHGKVVATSIEPRVDPGALKHPEHPDKRRNEPAEKPADPADSPRMRPGANYVGIPFPSVPGDLPS